MLIVPFQNLGLLQLLRKQFVILFSINQFKTMRSLFFISLIILFAACKKDNTTAPMAPSYKIATVTRTGKSISINYTLTYDGNGRIYQIVSDEPGGFKRTFSYKEDTIYMNVPNGPHASSATITLNSFKLMSTRKLIFQQSEYNATYNYDGSGQILSLNAREGSYTYPAITYTITNGDITNITSQGVTDTTTYFSDKASVIGNLDDIYQLLDFGAFYYRNKHLKKSNQSGNNKTDYSYSFDSEGKIISVITSYNFGAAPETTNFTYTKQ